MKFVNIIYKHFRYKVKIRRKTACKYFRQSNNIYYFCKEYMHMNGFIHRMQEKLTLYYK